MFVGGESHEFDEITRWASDDLGYVVAIEHAQVQRVGSDEFVPLDLRVTTSSAARTTGGAYASVTPIASRPPCNRHLLSDGSDERRTGPPLAQ